MPVVSGSRPRKAAIDQPPELRLPPHPIRSTDKDADGDPPLMAPDNLTFLGGLLMGLASSLHCASMCGAIASSLMFGFATGEGPSDRARALAPPMPVASLCMSRRA